MTTMVARRDPRLAGLVLLSFNGIRSYGASHG
jgi:hypothetical protein